MHNNLTVLSNLFSEWNCYYRRCIIIHQLHYPYQAGWYLPSGQFYVTWLEQEMTTWSALFGHPHISRRCSNIFIHMRKAWRCLPAEYITEAGRYGKLQFSWDKTRRGHAHVFECLKSVCNCAKRKSSWIRKYRTRWWKAQLICYMPLPGYELFSSGFKYIFKYILKECHRGNPTVQSAKTHVLG